MTELIPDEPNQHVDEHPTPDPAGEWRARSKIPGDEDRLADEDASEDALTGVLNSEGELGEQAKEQQRELRDPQ